MFLGLEVAGWLGAAVGLTFVMLFRAYMHERKERRYAEEDVQSWIKLSNSHFDSFWEVKRAWDSLGDEVVDLSRRLEVADRRLEETNGFVDELTEALGSTLADLDDAEAEIEELEEESDDLEESAIKATEGWQASVNLMTRIIAWGESVLDAESRGL